MRSTYMVNNLKLSNDDSYGDIHQSIKALEELPYADTYEQAHKLYWEIDNNLLIQGGLFSGAVKSLQFLMSSLLVSTEFARSYVLELIFQIMNGYINEESDQKNKEYRKWAAKNALGLGYYLTHLVLFGTDDEQAHAEDILSLVLIEYPDYEEILQGIKMLAIVDHHQEQAFIRIFNRHKQEG